MQVRAQAKFVRISPRKVRLVVDQVRGLSVEEAERLLHFMNKRGATPVLKLIKSAVANAEHNYKLKKENLFISRITADEGITIKRYRARAFGRAAMIRKRSSKLTVILDEKGGPKQGTQEAKKDVKKETTIKNTKEVKDSSANKKVKK